LDDLERRAAQLYRAAPGIEAVAAPGTQSLIQRLPSLCRGASVRILGPTYSEFARAFGPDRARVVASLAALDGADVAIIVNPNNPDGRLVPPPALLDLLSKVGMLVVDEAFADALPGTASLAPHLPPERGLILRSFGKFYGLAGVRLGFALMGGARAAALRQELGPWRISGPALSLASQALADEAWMEATRRRLVADGARLGGLLQEVGARAVGSTPLFQLVAHRHAEPLFAHLAEAGILTRPFRDQTDWLRFGLPGTESEWARLTDALSQFIA
jgi:cobalamin biosynthetic protein CobC